MTLSGTAKGNRGFMGGTDAQMTETIRLRSAELGRQRSLVVDRQPTSLRTVSEIRMASTSDTDRTGKLTAWGQRLTRLVPRRCPRLGRACAEREIPLETIGFLWRQGARSAVALEALP